MLSGILVRPISVGNVIDHDINSRDFLPMKVWKCLRMDGNMFKWRSIKMLNFIHGKSKWVNVVYLGKSHSKEDRLDHAYK